MVKSFQKCGEVGGITWKMKSASFEIIIASGVTGELVKITAPAGQLVRLHTLSTNTSVAQAGISVSVDAETVISEKILTRVTGDTSQFYLTRAINIAAGNLGDGAGRISELIGAEIIISKNAGNTLEDISYAYEFGVFE